MKGKIAAVENIEAQRYDRIRKEIRDSELIVFGEKKIPEHFDGLGGTFTYCTLGVPIEMDTLLTGKNLPTYSALGTLLFHMATNRPIASDGMREQDYYLGEADGQKIWLIYRPDLTWLKSPEAALTLSRAAQFAKSAPDKRHLVFASARFVSQKMLAEQNLSVEFVPLPFALYRVDRG